MRLKREFFNRPTVTVARELIGKVLCRRIDGKVIRSIITETEAYCGTKDLACHASKGLTSRTKIMFGPPGHAYVYLIYGMYNCLNIVTEREGEPSAVLIRTAEITNSKLQIPNKTRKKYKTPNPKVQDLRKFCNSNLDIGNCLGFGACDSVLKLKGPGILCRELKIDKNLNGADITNSKDLWIEESPAGIAPGKIKRGKRIGVDYAGIWKEKLWRFYS